ncbi:hypothetical protein C6N75_01130 [Streptomyces solincola]|uniref:EcsC family protein n=1 Tax=Streptomyces solincola TaxID=2100817 RepID=A0A2S9Q2U3_9ACTN|nr:hypothetical protein [Streptomyces solincola]PRH80991.1 hypothetical protein C6N75_01130 [Streptomyces solincola]
MAAGDNPHRKRRFRLTRKPEAQQGGADRTPTASDDSAEHTDLLPSAATRDDERGRAASLEARPGDGGPATRARRMAALRHGVRRGREGARAGLGHLADRLIELAPRIPVRDLDTLRRHFPGLGPEEIADRLVAGAANAASTVGAGVGAAAMLPVPPAMPAEMAAEITGIAAIELKLIAELHEVYGRRPPGTFSERAGAYLTSWTEERGIDVSKPASVNAALGGRMRRELRRAVTKRMVRNLPNLVPFMIGAVVGAAMNRRDTRKLAARIREDLRRHQVPWDALPDLPPLDRPRDAKSPKELGY